jgi:ribosomal protein S27AE
VDDPDEVIAMQLSCSRCGRTVKNDLPRSQMPTQIEFLGWLRSAGWSIGKVPDNKQLCHKCASSL